MSKFQIGDLLRYKYYKNTNETRLKIVLEKSNKMYFFYDMRNHGSFIKLNIGFVDDNYELISR